MQPLHTLLNIFVVQWIAYSCAFQELCDFIAIFWIDICNIIANMLPVNSLINCRLLTTVNKLVSSFARNTHDIFLSFTGKQERPICHSFFQNGNIRNRFRLCFQGCTNHLNCICFQLVRIAVDFPELLISIDFHYIC